MHITLHGPIETPDRGVLPFLQAAWLYEWPDLVQGTDSPSGFTIRNNVTGATTEIVGRGLVPAENPDDIRGTMTGWETRDADGNLVATITGIEWSLREFDAALFDLIEGGGDPGRMADLFSRQDVTVDATGMTDTSVFWLGDHFTSDLTYTGSRFSDDVIGGSGNDVVRGAGGVDWIEGGRGNDRLFGGAGRDSLQGDQGHDRLLGNTGSDSLYGGDGNDTLIGGAHSDTMFGDNGRDVLRGGAGNDRAIGGNGNDRLFGANGNDRLVGGDGDDRLVGGGGRDRLLGGNDDDVMLGGAGNDFMIGGRGQDVLIGGTGDDTMNGGNADDRLIGGQGDDTAVGGRGADSFVFNDGDDGLTIRDFRFWQNDRLELDDALWDGNLTAQQVVDTYGQVVGDDIVLDFGDGDGDVIVIEGITNTTQLAGSIDIV